MDQKIEFSIGPVPSDIALAWIANARKILAGVTRDRRALSIDVSDEMIELCDAFLMTWEVVASNDDVFEWTFASSEELLESVIEQWLQLGALTSDELDRMGLTWAPEWTQQMADAVVVAALEVIPKLSRATKRRFAERLEPRPEESD